MSAVEHRQQVHAGTFDDNLAPMLEIHRDLPADIRLDLPHAPISGIGMAHQHAGFKDRVHFA